MFYRRYGKRSFDVIASILLLTVTAPFLLAVVLLLYFQNGGEVLFYQRRPGFREQPFDIIKFKTMTDRKDSAGNLLPDMERITKVGSWVRRLSLDELPQLVNVLKGDMSLIGPRPLLFEYIPYYTKEQRRRHEVRPGITGWAQVNGRNSISWEKKFELDLYYIEHLSFSVDIKIVALTIIKILKREGINQSDSQPMQPFRGRS
jgi:lipopolysaccharide/colanic/teichoic acid biosynthesis glycosyltransferase